jgi:short-subunit dehydrogenase
VEVSSMKLASQPGLAVVTGAAGGLGKSFAKKLAERGYRLLLVDRRLEQLQQVCESLAEPGASAEPYAVDLTQREEVERLAKRLEQLDVDLLVNNAGFGAIDYFADTDADYLVGMADVHVIAPTILTRAVLPRMLQCDSGNILNVSSLACWFYSAGNVQYGATKSFLTVLTQALQQELRGTNVRAQVLCPGFVRTEFHEAESMRAYQSRPAPAAIWWMAADEVVDCALRSMGGKRVVVIPGLRFRILGRLSQMPLFQPIVQRLTWAPRSVPTQPVAPAQPVAPCLEPAIGMQQEAEMAG